MRVRRLNKLHRRHSRHGVAPRGESPAIGVAANGIVRRDDGRILLLRRRGDDPGAQGAWDLPGGKMDHGETLSETLVREAREETGLTLTVGPAVHICHFERAPFWVTCVTFACESAGREVRLSAEHDDFAWIDPREVPDRDYAPAIREQLDAYATSLA